MDIKGWEENKEWAKNHREQLVMLTNDLDLVFYNKSKIIAALDFADIFEQSFPFADVFKVRDESKRKEEKKGEKEVDRRPKEEIFEETKNDVMKRLLGRYGLIFNMNDLFCEPLLLLPPYSAESLDFYSRMASLVDYIKADHDSKSYLIKNIFNKFASIDMNNFEQLKEMLNREAPDLVFMYSSHFDDGQKIFIDLLKNYIRPFSQEIENILIKNLSGIEDFETKNVFESYLCEIHNSSNSQLEDLIEKHRPNPNKWLSNKRDAKSLQYTKMFNKKLNDDLLILVTYANHILRQKNNNEFIKIINGVKYPMIRETDYLYVVLLEFGELFSYESIDITEEIIIKLKHNIRHKINIIDNFLDLLANYQTIIDPLAGVLREQYRQDAEDTFLEFKKIKEAIDELEILDLIGILQKVTKKNESLSNLINYTTGDTRQITIQTLINIKETTERGNLPVELIIKRNNLESFLKLYSEDMERIVRRTLDRDPKNINKLCFSSIDMDETINKATFEQIKDGNFNILIRYLKGKKTNYSYSSTFIPLLNDRWVIIDLNINRALYIQYNKNKLEITEINLLYVLFSLNFINDKIINQIGLNDAEERFLDILGNNLILPLEDLGMSPIENISKIYKNIKYYLLKNINT